MTDTTYMLTLPADIQLLFKGLSNLNINQCSGKTAIMALNLAQRRPLIAFNKSGGKFYNKGMIADEVQRLLKRNPIRLTPLPCCDFCKKPVEEDDQAWTKDHSFCIHMDCDPDWEKARGYPFPYDCDDSETESETKSETKSEPEAKPKVEPEAEPEAEPVAKPEAEPVAKLEAKVWKAPWGYKFWRLAQGDVWHSSNHCWEVVKGEFFNYNTSNYLGKYDETEEEFIPGPRPRNPAHRFVS